MTTGKTAKSILTKIDFDKFKALLTRRVADPGNENVRDSVESFIRRSLPKKFHHVSDSFSETFDPTKHKVVEGIRMLKRLATQAWEEQKNDT